LLAVALALSAAPPLHAASASDEESAKAAIREARARRAKGDLVGAREQLQAAWSLVATPRNGVELAEAHEALGELVEARRVYVEVTKLPPYAKESPESHAARKKADERAATLSARIPTLTIALANLPTDAKATLRLDGQTVPLASLAAPRLLDPGKHEIVVEIEGGGVVRQTIELVERDRREVAIDVAPALPPKVTPKTETPRVPTPTPTPAPEPAPRRDEGSRSRTPTLAYVGFGVAGAGLVLGTVTGLVTLGRGSTLKDECPGGACDPRYADDLSRTRTLGNVSTISFVVAGVGLGVGLYGLFTAPRAEAAHARVEPWISVGSIGVRGAF
jgi:hypothetical protein